MSGGDSLCSGKCLIPDRTLTTRAPWAIVANGVTDMGAAEIKDFLERYYRGLSTSRARRKGTPPDPASMQAVVNPASGSDAPKRFTAQVVFYDSFSDGRKVTPTEAAVVPRPTKKQVCSPSCWCSSAKESDVWPPLRTLARKRK